MSNKKVFSKYIMEYKDNNIISVLDSSNKETMFSFTFYNSNKEVLDMFDNILDFVKPKRETKKYKNLVINLENFSLRYSSNETKISEEDLKLALKIVRSELSDANPEIAKRKALLVKYHNDIKTLEALEVDGLTFEEEKEDINEKIDALRVEIDTLLEE